MVILDSGERMMMSNLAESLGVPLSTATHTVDRLVAKGLVERNRSEEDRRVVEVRDERVRPQAPGSVSRQAQGGGAQLAGAVERQENARSFWT